VVLLAQASAQNPQKQPDHVRGTVINSATHAPIARALVASPDNRFATLTDGDGRFEFEMPSANGAPIQVQYGTSDSGNTLGLSARKPGFLAEPGIAQNSITANGELELALTPEAIIKGRVIVPGTDGLANFNVQLFKEEVHEGRYRWQPRAMARTSFNGEFRFAELAQGVYKVFSAESMDNDPVASPPDGQHYGFPPVYYPAAKDFADGAAIPLTAGQIVEADIPLTRQPYFPIQIPVINAPPGFLNITVSILGHKSPGYTLGYSAQKQEVIGELPTGHYVVGANGVAQGAVVGSMNLTVAGAPARGPAMSVGPGSSITFQVDEEFTSKEQSPPNVVLRRRSSGSVGPRANLDVVAEETDKFEPQSGRSFRPPANAQDTSMVIDGLSPGRYSLSFYPRRGYVASATAGGVDLLHEPLPVGAGANLQATITMRDDFAQLIVSTKNPSVGATDFRGIQTVAAIPLDGPGTLQSNQIPVGQDFAVQLPPGSYRVLSLKNQDPSSLPYRDPEAMRAYESQGQVVHLSPSQQLKIQLQTSGSE
jgi:hypothetical protein